MEALKAKTRGTMKPTPYTVNGEQLDFSYDRSSKVHYLSERNNELVAQVSRRLLIYLLILFR